MIDRLAAYEDTGLEPEDIQSLEAEWCICKQLVEEYRAIGTIDHLRELVQAEAALEAQKGDSHEADL